MERKILHYLFALMVLFAFAPSMRAEGVSGDVTDIPVSPDVPVFPVVIDNIYYLLDEEEMTASVVSVEANYDETFVTLSIPATITNEGEEYTVTSCAAIGDGSCRYITTIEFPATVTSIDCRNFFEFESLTNIVVDAANPSYAAIDGVLFNKAGTRLEVYPFALEATSYAVSSTVTALGDYAFYGNMNLTTISLPSGVTSIGSHAFGNVDKLVALTVKATTPVAIASTTFEGLLDFATLFVPSGMVGSYQSAAQWNNFHSIVEGSMASLPQVTVEHFDYLLIGNTAINYNYNAKDWSYYADEVIPATIDYEGSTYNVIGCMPALMRFCNCSSVWIDAPLTSIPPRMFDNAQMLREVSIPESVTSIGDDAFIGCDFSSIKLPEGLTTIGDDAFLYCEYLFNISLPASVSSIGDNAFSGCQNLQYVKVERREPLEISSWVFSNIHEYCTLEVPYGCKPAYEMAAGWSEFAFINNSSIDELPNDTINNIIYYIVDGKAFVGGYDESNPPVDLVIPASITIEGETYAVEQIADFAFEACESLESLVLPSSIHTINSYAFEFCSNLASVTFSEGLSYIGDKAFRECENLTSITLPEGVTHVGERGFAYCNKLHDISLPSTLTTLTNSLFAGTFALTKMIVPEGVEIIEDEVFLACFKLTDISLPSTLTMINEFAFSEAYNLTSVSVAQRTPIVVPSNLFEDISQEATLYVPAGSKSAYENEAGWDFFQNIVEGDAPASSLVTVGNISYLPHSDYATIIGYNADATLGDITLPSTVTLNGTSYPVRSIGIAAFLGCSTLGNVTIEEGIEGIESGAFVNSSITGLSIPASLTTIADEAFYELSHLATIEVADQNANYMSENNALFNKEQSTLLMYAVAATATTYTVPSSVLTIAESAFTGNTNLRSIELNDGLKSIESYAFEGCSGLTTLYIPASVVSMGEYLNYKAAAITKVYVASETPAVVTYYPFNNRENITLYVPVGSKEAYETTEYWNEFAEIVEIDVASDMSATTTTTAIAAANGAVVVDGAANGATLVVYNAAGSVVYSGVVTDATATISLPAGLYIVCVEGEAATRLVVR